MSGAQGAVPWDVVGVVAAGGAIGAAARHAAALAWPHPVGEFPWATFVVNATGCLLLGLLMALVVEVWPTSRYARPMLGVGVLGGYTTFSAYALETRDLLAAGRPEVAGGYVAASLVAGLVGVWLGLVLARVMLYAGPLRRRR